MEYFITILPTINNFIAFVGIILGIILAIFIYFQFAPVLNPKIIARWEGQNNEFLIVRIELENKSKVRFKTIIAKLQILEQEVDKKYNISEWVPFSKRDTIFDEEPKKWREAEEILHKDQKYYPNEICIIERLYYLPEEVILLHIGLQIKMHFGIIGKIINRNFHDWSQTTTIFVTKPKTEIK